MKKLFVILSFFCLLVPCLAEEAEVVSIYGIQQPKNLFMRCVLANGDRMLLVSQGTWGKISLEIFDTKTGNVVYEEKGFDLQSASVFCNQECFFVYKPGDLLYCRDVMTGQIRWHKKESSTIKPFWVNDEHLILQKKIRLGNDSFGDYYYSINVKSGLNEWTTNMDMGDGINYVQEEEDTLYISTSDNLYQLNLKTGATFVLPSKNQVVSGKRLAGQIGIGVAAAAAVVVTAGALLGNGYYIYAYPTYRGNRMTLSSGHLLANNNNISSYALADVCSNVLSYQNRSYFADSKSLYCLDKSMNSVWTASFPKRRASNSYLYQVGDTLIMANHGSAFLGGTKIRKMGRPFLAAYRMQDGERLFYRELSDDKESHPQNLVSSGKVLSLTDEKIYCISLPDTTVQMVRWDTTQYGAILYLADNPCYKINAESYRFDSLAVGLDCVVTNRGEAYRASTTADPELVATRSVLYRVIGALREDVYCVSGGIDGKDYWVIRRSGEPIYHFTEPVNIMAISRSSIQFSKPDKKDKNVYVAKLNMK